MYDPRTKEATRAYFADEQALLARLAVQPKDTTAVLRLARLQIGGDRPLKALARLRNDALDNAPEPGPYRKAALMLLELGAFESALRMVTRGLALGDSAALHAVHDRASRRLAEDEALGMTTALKLTYLAAMQDLIHGHAETARPQFEQVTAEAPRYAAGWIGLRGALEALGDTTALSDFARRWRAADPSAGSTIKIVQARRLRAGLVFDRRKPLPMRGLRDALQEVRSLAALQASPAAFLPLDPGGERVLLDPVISQRPDGSDRVVVDYSTPEVFLAAVDNAALVGRGSVIDAEGAMVRDLHGPNLQKYALIDDGAQVMFDPGNPNIWLGEVKVYDTPAMLMAGASDQSFGDWMLIYVPRLAIARDAGLKCPVVVSANAPEPFLELLRQLGLSDDEIIRHNPQGVSLFRKLYVPSWPLRDYLAPMSGLFEIYRELALPAAPAPGRRIYLSRERVPRRDIVNEPALRELFERHGFETIHPQELSLRQMRELMAQADYVAAPYGSALLNLAMSVRKPKVIVCVPAGKYGFLRQAAMWLGSIGLQFAYVLGHRVGDLGPLGEKDAEWTVPLDDAARTLEAVLSLP